MSTPQVTIPNRIESAGIDWLTVTAKSREGQSRLLDIAHDERRYLIEAGYEIETGIRLGYSGWQSRGYFFGTREDSTMTVASGGDAHRLFPLLSEAADNITRLDLQVTVELLDAPARLASQGDAMLKRGLPSKVKPRSFTLIQQYPHGETLNVNKRVTDTYGRLYDKASEEGRGRPGSRWRYEVEFKRDAAKSVTNYLNGSHHLETAATAIVHQWWDTRGVTPIYALLRRSENLSPTPRTEGRDVLMWFEETLSKTVRKAASQYGLNRVIESLGLRELVESELQERSVSDASWGHPISLAFEADDTREHNL